MKTLTKYQADDGTEFANEADCITHESLCAEVDALMNLLPQKPDLPGCAFENGGGYIQHDEATFLAVRKGLLEIANRISPHKWFDQSIADPDIDPSWAGRIIGECCPPVERAWRRIGCIDTRFREWGQPYYRTHPHKAEQIQLN